MKAILMSIKPQWVVNILNGEKTIEIRKKFPSDYVGWVYIYCTKAPLKNCSMNDIAFYCMGSGKVVARFWCDKVEKIRSYLEPEQWYMTSDLGGSGLLQKSCLTFKELDDYLLSGDGFAIYITKLEIFDKPKELKNFLIYSHTVSGIGLKGEEKQFKILKPLTRAPQSWCYVEIENG